MATSKQSVKVTDLITAEDIGTHCDTCSDPIDRGELIAVLSNGARVHDDNLCRHPEGSDLTQTDPLDRGAQTDYLLGYM
jgi:hypothetical protein